MKKANTEVTLIKDIVEVNFKYITLTKDIAKVDLEYKKSIFSANRYDTKYYDIRFIYSRNDAIKSSKFIAEILDK